MQIIQTIRQNQALILQQKDLKMNVKKEGNYLLYTLEIPYDAAYGFGEKFDAVNQIGRNVIVQIRERCFYQEDYTYCTFPFLTTPNGFGLYVNTKRYVEFDLTKKGIIGIKVEDTEEAIPELYYFEGTIKEIMQQFKLVTAPTRLFPKWVLGAWLSSNRWANQAHIDEQIKALDQSKIPHNVMVIERWSDLTTFYNWNESKYQPYYGEDYLHYEDFEFTNTKWPNPKEMVQQLHDRNVKVLLWDLPVITTEKTVEGPNPEQRYRDNEYIVKMQECVMTKEQKPYLIPLGNWFGGSMIPDFTNKEATKHWFEHRTHLFDIGIDGFKTDGGEFVYSKEALFANGETGVTMINGYADSYIRAYHESMSEDKVIYSRAGHIESAQHTITWAGDQESTWSEYRSILKAGLSAGLSGISNWGFDAAGFAGYLPSKTLYLRSMQMAAFVPIMQWHSEPITNGRCDFSQAWKNNDRSPWNMSEFYKDDEMLEEVKKTFNLHYNLIPYFYQLTLEAHKTGTPVLRHLAYEFSDPEVYGIEDQFLVGNALLVASILEDYTNTRKVYLPEGKWYDLYESTAYEGKQWIDLPIHENRTPAFIRHNSCIPLHLDGSFKLGSYVGNELNKYDHLCFLVCGQGSYEFQDDLGNAISLEYDEQQVKITKNLKHLEVTILAVQEGGEQRW